MERKTHAEQDADGESKDEDVEKDFAGASGHPEDVVVEAVARVCQRVDPTPLERDAVGQGGNGAPNPETNDQSARHPQLVAEGIAHGKDAVVHEEDAQLGRARDGEVEDRRCKGELEVEVVSVRVPVVWVGIFRDVEADGVHGIAPEGKGRSQQRRHHCGQHHPVVRLDTLAREDARVEAQGNRHDGKRNDEPADGHGRVRGRVAPRDARRSGLKRGRVIPALKWDQHGRSAQLPCDRNVEA